MFTGRPVRDDLASFLPATLELTLASIVLALVIGVPSGVLSAVTGTGGRISARGRWRSPA